MLSISTIFCATVTVLCFAVPTLPQAKKIPDEILSTAGIRRVQLEVAPVPKPLAVAGNTASKIQQIAEQMLVESGIEVDEDPSTPKLVVAMVVASSDMVDGALAMTTTIDVHQNISVHRLDMDLNVPTMTIVIPALLRRDEFATAPSKQCRDAFNLLLKTFDLANEPLTAQRP